MRRGGMNWIPKLDKRTNSCAYTKWWKIIKHDRNSYNPQLSGWLKEHYAKERGESQKREIVICI